jgi:hypothetical protein
VFIFAVLAQGLSTSGNGEGGSEQIRAGAQISKNRQQIMLSGFVYVKVSF